MRRKSKAHRSWLTAAMMTPPLLFCAVASFAQEPQMEPEARKVDEYGKIGHCDMSARLDNFAVALQNDPSAKGYVVAYDPAVRKYDYAGRQLKIARHYLVHSRGVAPERVVVVRGGNKGESEGAIELWFVPAGATPPVEQSAPDKYAATDFSGKFDSYATDMRIFREIVELGYSDEDISRAEFSEKLKRQPDSVGYLIIKTPADAPPGVWQGLARREEQILRKDHEVETGRLKSVDGGASDGELAEVELWILPDSAPPPAGGSRKAGPGLTKAVKLYKFESYGEDDDDAEGWMLENLAGLLRGHPRASAYLIAREPELLETDMSEGGEVIGSATRESSPEPKGQDSQTEGDEAGEREPESVSIKETAEEWRRKLAANYGVDASRVVILEGRQAAWGNGRLNVWLVPEKAARPDPLARDEDDPDEESQ